MASMVQINRALKNAGHDVEIVKGQGYFYFGSKNRNFKYDYIPSIYVYRVSELGTPADIVKYVEDELKEIDY